MSDPQTNAVRVPSMAILSGLLCLLIIFLAFVGSIEALPYWLRGLIQAGGGIAGLFAGWSLQENQSEIRQRGAVRAASAGLIALAKTTQIQLRVISDRRASIADSSYKSIAALQESVDATLAGVEGHLTGNLAQIEASVAAWRAVDPAAVTEQLEDSQVWIERVDTGLEGNLDVER